MSYYGNLYLPLQAIDLPKGNSATITYTAKNKLGELVDISGALEITFSVLTDSPANGGALVFEKTLSGGDIVMHGDDNRFSFTITAAETAAISGRLLYHECNMQTSAHTRTGSAGVFRAETTYTGSI